MPHLRVHPRETCDFETFRRTQAAPAVALDGYVRGVTRVDRDGYANFNHHEDTDRFTTRATCGQVALALRMGCDTLIEDGRRPRRDLTIHVNDADPDVCLSVWLLTHPDALNEVAIDRLVALEDAIDTSAGVFAAGTVEELDELGWVIEPWATQLAEMAVADADDMATIIREVGERIDRVRDGTAETVNIAGSYDIIESRRGVCAVVEHHPLARARLTTDQDFDVFVSVREGPRVGTTTVSIGTAGPFRGVDLAGVFAQLNTLENIVGIDRWGGSDQIGGSPRAGGTKLSVTEILDVVHEELALTS